MDKLPEYRSRLGELLPGVDLSNVRLQEEAGVGTDVVVLGETLIALFRTNPVSYTAPRNAAICNHIRPAITLALPEAVAAAEDVVVFKVVPGVPLERHWLLRQTEMTQQCAADQLGGFLRELHAIPVPTLADLQLRDYSTSLTQFEKQYERIRRVVFPELHPSAVSWARDHCETFLHNPQLCDHPTFQHSDLVPWHILVDQKGFRISGVLDFGSGGIGDPAVDLSNLLLAYGEHFVARITKAYPESEGFIYRARFLTGMMYLRWISNGIQTNERRWLLHHLISARDLLPLTMGCQQTGPCDGVPAAHDPSRIK